MFGLSGPTDIIAVSDCSQRSKPKFGKLFPGVPGLPEKGAVIVAVHCS